VPQVIQQQLRLEEGAPAFPAHLQLRPVNPLAIVRQGMRPRWLVNAPTRAVKPSLITSAALQLNKSAVIPVGLHLLNASDVHLFVGWFSRSPPPVVMLMKPPGQQRLLIALHGELAQYQKLVVRRLAKSIVDQIGGLARRQAVEKTPTPPSSSRYTARLRTINSDLAHPDDGIGSLSAAAEYARK
jgi:hypothetical protein